MMPRLPLKRAFFLLAALVVAGCQAAPVTGRQQFILLSDAEANQLVLQAYQGQVDPRQAQRVGVGV